MTRRTTETHHAAGPLLALLLSLSFSAGCAGTSPRAGTTSAEASAPAPQPDPELYLQCEDDSAAGGLALDATLPADGRAEDASGSAASPPASAPARTRGSDVAPSAAAPRGDSVSEQGLGVGGFYASQGAGLGALACALAASDCEGAAGLVVEICRLAERVCELDTNDPHCQDARTRCLRARARVSTRCQAE